MIDLDELELHINDEMLLEFEDGHAVRARLISVEKDEPAEIIYDVLEVIEVGPSRFGGVRVGTKAAADPRQLRRASSVI